MAIFVSTPEPERMLELIYQLIDENGIDTRKYDSNNNLYHNVEQWENEAYFEPFIKDHKLYFFIRSNSLRNKAKDWQDVYSIYHGRLIEQLNAHCFELFDAAWFTSKPYNAKISYKLK